MSSQRNSVERVTKSLLINKLEAINSILRSRHEEGKKGEDWRWHGEGYKLEVTKVYGRKSWYHIKRDRRSPNIPIDQSISPSLTAREMLVWLDGFADALEYTDPNAC